ncbi:hypothetical protein NQ318_000827 [Aromia moschata]|uniref:Uncharacterized protein n=1 Tax=Aromia moschata TaxID=1265417 RepID=A0AAV8XJ07_9CUCU|nr:hypothetical protein NQ318_000827 [Aromia moschata]
MGRRWDRHGSVAAIEVAIACATGSERYCIVFVAEEEEETLRCAPVAKKSRSVPSSSRLLVHTVVVTLRINQMVAKLLTLEQKESRMNICSDILNNIDTDTGLLDTVITCDESVEAVKAKATEVLNQLVEADFQHCFQQWKSRMERCRDRQGKYIEGEKVATVIGND